MACGIFPNQGIEPMFPASAGKFSTARPQGSTALSLVDRSSYLTYLWLGVSAIILLVDQCLSFGPVVTHGVLFCCLDFLFSSFLCFLCWAYPCLSPPCMHCIRFQRMKSVSPCLMWVLLHGWMSLDRVVGASVGAVAAGDGPAYLLGQGCPTVLLEGWVMPSVSG